MTRVWIFTVFIIGLWNCVSEATLCTTRGRFPNEEIPYCRGYTMCLSAAPGVYMQYDLSCPENFVYSHLDSQCTNITSYQCYPQHNCTSEGNFVVDTDKNCTSYIACVQGLIQISTARLISCPDNTLYSPQEGACVNSTMFMCEIEKPSIDLDASPSQDAGATNTSNAVNMCGKALLIYLMFGLAM